MHRIGKEPCLLTRADGVCITRPAYFCPALTSVVLQLLKLPFFSFVSLRLQMGLGRMEAL